MCRVKGGKNGEIFYVVPKVQKRQSLTGSEGSHDPLASLDPLLHLESTNLSVLGDIAKLKRVMSKIRILCK